MFGGGESFQKTADNTDGNDISFHAVNVATHV